MSAGDLAGDGAERFVVTAVHAEPVLDHLDLIGSPVPFAHQMGAGLEQRSGGRFAATGSLAALVAKGVSQPLSNECRMIAMGLDLRLMGQRLAHQSDRDVSRWGLAEAFDPVRDAGTALHGFEWCDKTVAIKASSAFIDSGQTVVIAFIGSNTGEIASVAIRAPRRVKINRLHCAVPPEDASLASGDVMIA